MSRSQKTGINLIKNLQALIFVRVPLETLPTDRKLNFNSNNIDSKNYCSGTSGNNNGNNYNNEYK